MSLYERAGYLDNALGVLQPRAWTAASRAAASEVLKLAVLAFASQWSTSRHSPFTMRATTPGNDSEAADICDDSHQFVYLIRQSLWSQLNNALARLSDCNSFQVITAKLILFFISRPLDTEERHLMRDILNREFMPQATQEEQPGDIRSIRSEVPRPQTARSLFELLDVDSRYDHLRTAMYKLAWWRGRVQNFLAQTSPTKMASNGVSPRSLRKHILQACPQFNLLSWFAVMLDTARATLHRRPLIFLDHETESLIVRHNSDKLKVLCEDDTNVVMGSTGNFHANVRESLEVWEPLLQKPFSACDDPFTHARANFTQRLAYVLQDATPMTVLIIRKAAHLQAAVSTVSSAEHVEHCIAEVLDVCSNWDVRYRRFFENCIAEHASLPFMIRSWYLMIFGHWLVGCLRALELIDQYDRLPQSASTQQVLRVSTSVVQWLQRDSSYKLSKLARASSLDGCINVTDRSNMEYHPVMRPGSLLTEPGPDIMIFGLKSACDNMLAWLQVLRTPPIVTDPRNVWVHHSIETRELFENISSCVLAMNQLGRLSCFAENTADIYQRLLDIVRNRPVP
jgi:hypothetical protein